MELALLPLAAGVLLGLVGLAAGIYSARRALAGARRAARKLLHDAGLEAENKQKEILVSAQERLLALQEEADARERALDERESQAERRARDLERRGSELERERARIERGLDHSKRVQEAAREAERAARADVERARAELERIANLTREQARLELVSSIEAQARAEAARRSRKIEDEARQTAERRAVELMIRAAERVNLREVVETTVSFIELPSDEMKGRIIGREGRNIRALEMATGIDLIVDDTPRSILISCFDPLRREMARVAIDRLVEDGRIHPARIEEVVEKVRGEVEELVDRRGSEAAYELGISDLHPKLVRLVGRMRFHTCHGQNLLQHCRETALIAAHMAQEVGGRVEIALRAGLLHEIGQVDPSLAGHPILNAAELGAKYGEPEAVVDAIRALHPDVEATRLESLLVGTASRISESRPGARKENLAVFIERLRRLEEIARRYPGVDNAFAVKAGKELRVIVDASGVDDERTVELSRELARAVERELSYPGQIKISVIRETRAVRYAV